MFTDMNPCAYMFIIIVARLHVRASAGKETGALLIARGSMTGGLMLGYLPSMRHPGSVPDWTTYFPSAHKKFIINHNFTK